MPAAAESEKHKSSLLIAVRLAENAERYPDMVDGMTKFVKYMISQGETLNVEERNLLSLAFKNVVGAYRSAARVILQNFPGKEGSPESQQIAEKCRCRYLEHIQQQVQTSCNALLDLLEQMIAQENSGVPESKAFYLKMKGDYYRYKAENAPPDMQKEHSTLAKEAYDQATVVAEHLHVTNPIRLGLALNFSVFHYEVMGNVEGACKMARTAFESAIAELDTVNEDVYKDSTLIMQLLRDNLTLWTSSSEETQNEASEPPF